MSETIEISSRKRKRSGGAAERRKARTRGPIVHLPTAVRNIPTYDVLDHEGLERIDDHAMQILETTGIEFREDQAAGIWRDSNSHYGLELVS